MFGVEHGLRIHQCEESIEKKIDSFLGKSVDDEVDAVFEERVDSDRHNPSEIPAKNHQFSIIPSAQFLTLGATMLRYISEASLP